LNNQRLFEERANVFVSVVNAVQNDKNRSSIHDQRTIFVFLLN